MGRESLQRTLDELRASVRELGKLVSSWLRDAIRDLGRIADYAVNVAARTDSVVESDDMLLY